MINQAIAESRAALQAEPAERAGARQPVRGAPPQGDAAAGHDRADERNAQGQFRRRGADSSTAAANPEKAHMKTLIGIIAAAVLVPASAAAQVSESAVTTRVVVQTTQQTQTEQRAQERARENQERAKEIQQRERERAQERANQNRREFREEQSEQISRTLKIGGNGELDLSNLSGDIIITRGAGNERAARGGQDGSRPHRRGSARDADRRQGRRRRARRAGRSEESPTPDVKNGTAPAQRQRVGALHGHRPGGRQIAARSLSGNIGSPTSRGNCTPSR